MKQLIALAALPLMAAPAMAAPYVESKTTAAGVITEGGEFSGAQTELRVGYQQEVGTGVTVFGEIGPGYEWNNGGTNEGVAVGEVGVNFPIAENLTGKFKVAGEYGFDSEVFALGGELKVRYSF
jgi:opacity protein-like surface antigen